MSSFKRLGSRVHPDGEAADDSKRQLARPTSMRPQRSLRPGVSGRARLSAAAAEQERAKGLLLPEDEHAAWLADKVRREGRQSAAKLLRFYLRMLGPVAILSVFFFGLAAGFSYAIPNLLCNRVAKENSVSGRAVLKDGNFKCWVATPSSCPVRGAACGGGARSAMPPHLFAAAGGPPMCRCLTSQHLTCCSVLPLEWWNASTWSKVRLWTCMLPAWRCRPGEWGCMLAALHTSHSKAPVLRSLPTPRHRSLTTAQANCAACLTTYRTPCRRGGLADQALGLQALLAAVLDGAGGLGGRVPRIRGGGHVW